MDDGIRRVVGRKSRQITEGAAVTDADIAWTKRMSGCTRAPKGIFRYKNHDEANKDRERWAVEAVVAAARDRTPL